MNRHDKMDQSLTRRWLYRDVVHYAELGEHRTASAVDIETSHWIRNSLLEAGIDAEFDTWPLRQFQLDECWVELHGKRFGAFPLWHPTPAGPSPLKEQVVLAEPGADISGKIALARFDDLMVTRSSCHAEAIEALVKAGATAIIGCTPHESSEIYGQNVIDPFNQTPWPIPIAMIAPRHWHAFANAAFEGDSVRFMLAGHDQMDAKAHNVIGTIKRGPRWVIISTPQSGWFRCSGERGAGIAVFLELARWAAASQLEQSFIFLSSSGHEIGHMGIHNILAQNIVPSPDDTDCWLHLGASVGTRNLTEADGVLKPDGPERESWLLCSDSIKSFLSETFQDLPHLTPEVYKRKNGEIRWILEQGYDACALMGPQRFFHLESDGPEAVDPDLLTDVVTTLKKTIEMLPEHRT